MQIPARFNNRCMDILVGFLLAGDARCAHAQVVHSFWLSSRARTPACTHTHTHTERAAQNVGFTSTDSHRAFVTYARFNFDLAMFSVVVFFNALAPSLCPPATYPMLSNYTPSASFPQHISIQTKCQRTGV